MQIKEENVPLFIQHVCGVLEDAGYETYLVGGCVRDILIGKNPKDWDLTTSAKPEDIIKLFPKTVYENVFGTVLVVNEDAKDGDATGVEVTPFRIEGKYTDKRHPDKITFGENIKEDLSRRDFTINAFAYRLKTKELIDEYSGLTDLKNKIIKTVGDSDERFNEDPLRLIRAIRFSSELGFGINAETMNSIVKNSNLIKHISYERIRDEFVKIIKSNNPSLGIEMLRRFNLLDYIIPEFKEAVGCVQGGAHKYDVYEHLLYALEHSAKKNYDFHVRLSALFHDIGKPKTRRPGVKKAYTFYGHEVVGARIAKTIMERLKFPKYDTDLVVKLIRYHMFFSDTELITISAVRRIIVNVGVDHIWQLMEVRECDRAGMAKSESPYRLRKYFVMIEEALRDPISVKQLKINGNDLKNLKVLPGPKMGFILQILLDEVIDDATKNTQGYLFDRAVNLYKEEEKTLRELSQKSRQKIQELEKTEVTNLFKKYNVN